MTFVKFVAPKGAVAAPFASTTARDDFLEIMVDIRLLPRRF